VFHFHQGEARDSPEEHARWLKRSQAGHTAAIVQGNHLVHWIGEGDSIHVFRQELSQLA
jgi:hypothetical protein